VQILFNRESSMRIPLHFEPEKLASASISHQEAGLDALRLLLEPPHHDSPRAGRDVGSDILGQYIVFAVSVASYITV
jgi:hypothetical protein